jgi:LysR family transcriptional regulator, transcriptional activator of the cysJI operon
MDCHPVNPSLSRAHDSNVRQISKILKCNPGNKDGLCESLRLPPVNLESFRLNEYSDRRRLEFKLQLDGRLEFKLQLDGVMHLETLKTFCDLIETGSFSKAAALNFISQSAVSQQMKALEGRFGQQLLERTARKGVALTEAGRLFYAECKEIVDRFRALEERMRDQTRAIAGAVRVATVYSLGLHDLPPYVKAFMRAHPQVKVHIEYNRTDRVHEACLNNSIDFGIVALPLRRPNIAVIPLREDKLAAVCAPDHPLAGRRRVSLKKLAGEDFIAFEPDIPTRKTIDRILRTHGVAVNIVMEFDNIETIKRSVEVGIGLSILPETAVVSEVRGGSLVALEFTEGVFTRPIGIIHRKGKIFSAAAREFVRLLTETSPGAP